MSHDDSSVILSFVKIMLLGIFFYKVYNLRILREGARGGSSRNRNSNVSIEVIRSTLKSHGKHIHKLEKKVKELSKLKGLEKRVSRLEDKTEDIPDN